MGIDSDPQVFKVRQQMGLVRYWAFWRARKAGCDCLQAKGWPCEKHWQRKETGRWGGPGQRGPGVSPGKGGERTDTPTTVEPQERGVTCLTT